MSFRKNSSLEILGFIKGRWSKSASNNRVVSYYLENKLAIDLEEHLDSVADIYKISRDPSDYLLIPARANSIGRFNANKDGWTFPEIYNFRPELGCRTYATYNNKPHFVEHQASRYEVARGVILDSHLNIDNDASDQVKEEVYNAIGEIPVKDAFVETILAVDTTKDRALADAYKSGAIKTFSMGADVEDTVCNICGNVATSTFDFCPHIRDKFSNRKYRMDDGKYRTAGELCRGTIFQELSVVSDPADKTAVIQDGILNISKAASLDFSEKDLKDVAKFTARYASEIPEGLAKIVNSFLNGRGL